jgi:hypothetical protein
VTPEVAKISAIGTRGDAKGKVFVAKKDSSGRYVLNKKTSSNSINPTNKAVNKVFVSSLTEAAKLLATEDYLINLVDEEGKRALREFKKVKIEYAGV